MSGKYWEAGLWIVLSTASAAALAQTQTPAGTGDALAEITVTARKTTENLQK